MRHKLRIISVVSGRQNVFVGVGADGQPVAKIVAALFHPQTVRVLFPDVSHPARHGVPVVVHDLFVAIRLIHRPRHDDSGISPRGRAVGLVHFARRDIGETAVARLSVLDIAHPFLEKRRNVAVERGGARENLRVAHPTQPLVTLRTIGRNRQKIAALSPVNVALQLVHKRRRTGKRTGLTNVRTDDAARDSIERGRAGKTAHFNVSKAVKCAERFPRFQTASAANKGVGRARRAQVGRVNRAVGVKHFGKTHFYARSRRAAHLEARHADHVLAHIEYPRSGRALRDFDRPQILRDAHSGAARGDQSCRAARRLVERAISGARDAQSAAFAVGGQSHRFVFGKSARLWNAAERVFHAQALERQIRRIARQVVARHYRQGAVLHSRSQECRHVHNATRNGCGRQHRACPTARVKRRGVPTGLLFAGVEVFAHQHIGILNRAGRALPRGIGRNELMRAVPELDIELRAKCGHRSVEVAAARKTDVAGIPAIAHQSADGVGACFELARHIIGLVLDAASVVRPTGRQNFVADFASVEPHFIHAARARKQRGAPNRFGDIK